ncbi:FCD domain-containing protein [Caulobacter sp. UC70_42]|uniref:FCD domain-containing protein n=1 Tax=Caulobacter sp. UC70_42 TaxID=3374551 RepID=UPI003757CFF5
MVPRTNRKPPAETSAKAAGSTGRGPSRLQADLAARILRLLKEQGAGPGHHLVELDLCEHFGVSRTPIRGALKLLADQGAVEARANRGFVLLEPVIAAPEIDPVNLQEEDDQRLAVAIAQARNVGRLAADCTQQEIMRLFDAKLPQVLRVLRRLSALGLVERKAGNGWTFLPSIDSARAQAESYAFRHALEPALLVQPTFSLDRGWLAESRAKHLAFRERPWRDVLAVEFYEMNSDFHEGLARCSGNRFMLAAVQQQIQLRRFLNYNWEYGVERVQESITEHLEILDALDAGHNERASALMRNHLTTSAHHGVMNPDHAKPS